MAGTDDTVADDDALYVLTAVLLTPAQFPGVLGDDYVAACSVLGLEPYAEGYGLVLGQDGGGARWTVVVDDVSLVAVAIASWDCGMEYDLSPDGGSVVSALPGWPLSLAVAAPGVPEPHDPSPEPGAEGPAPLTPPDPALWGPAQRRLGADEVASQWATWRGQIAESEFAQGSAPVSGASTSSPDPDTSPDQGRSAGTPPGESPGGDKRRTSGPHPGVRRALAEARAYVTEPPRPAGYARPSPRAVPGPCGPTVPAGRWSPGPTTSPSCCWTRNQGRSCRSAVVRNCPGCSGRSTSWPSGL
ncbi:hypothetical protein [Streptomyces sp. DpondAA-F4a]|uniref:hypothetical protein n=1 Tax=Streptomyces sp. DpondAA-F4a TaxID=1839771 RepID=UPI00081D76C2|nr:hypothetical protein GA0115235_119989 [Streptomyces sp. DpondAA-F4a]